MTIFHRLRVLSEFRRQRMPFVRSLVDMDLLREIGYHQAARRPLTLSVLFRQRLASMATVQRRLDRLKRLHVVQTVAAEHDGRLLLLVLSPKAWNVYRQLEKEMRRTPLGRLGRRPPAA